MDNFTITRSADYGFLFNLTDNKTGKFILIQESFEVIQDYLGIIPEDYSRMDDGRYMLII